MPPVPPREEMLPVSTGNHCLFCGTPDWTWLYLLRREPDWVKQLSWTLSWHVFLCNARHDIYESDIDFVGGLACMVWARFRTKSKPQLLQGRGWKFLTG